MNFVHKQVPLKIWADIDEGIVDFVRKLNTIPGVRILDSDQGDLLQGGVRYAWVNVSWPDDNILYRLQGIGNLVTTGQNIGILYPYGQSKNKKPEDKMAPRMTVNQGRAVRQ